MNPDSTAAKVIAYCEAGGFKPTQHGKQWRMNSPIRVGANSHSFGLVIEDDAGEIGGYIDRTHPDQGSLYDLAKALGIETPAGRTGVRTTKVEYEGLDDYSARHGVLPTVFEQAGWKETIFRNRRALEFSTAHGARWRFLDGAKPPYANTDGYTRCWYGLKKAADRAQKQGLPLVICNGEASTVVAFFYGLAACAITSGEQVSLPDDMVAELKAAYPSGSIIIAYDSDETGRERGPKLAQAIAASGFMDVRAVDMELSEGGDLADWCRLYDTEAAGEIAKCYVLWGTDKAGTTVPVAPKRMPITTWDEATELARGIYEGSGIYSTAPPLVLPFSNITALGGMAELIPPGVVFGLAAPSGVGKTSIAETIVDFWRKEGNSGVWWGNEWTPDTYVHRVIQREGGPSVQSKRRHQLWYSEEARGITGDQHTRFAIQATEADEILHHRILDEVRAWSGSLTFITKNDIDRISGKRDAGPTMQFIVAAMRNYVLTQRAIPGSRPISFAVLDYLQLVASTQGEDMEQRLQLFKQMCIDLQLVGLMTSQVTKSASSDASKGDALGQEQMQFVRSDKLNLLMILSRPVDEAGVRSAIAKVVVAKNSGGEPGQATIWQDRQTAKWHDTTRANINEEFGFGQ